MTPDDALPDVVPGGGCPATLERLGVTFECQREAGHTGQHRVGSGQWSEAVPQDLFFGQSADRRATC